MRKTDAFPREWMDRHDRPFNDRSPADAPETPATEPSPMPVQELSPSRMPYVVSDAGARGLADDRPRKERRGFASMSADKQREIASRGGRAAHEKGTAHEWTSEEARMAGRKGGQISRGGRGRLSGLDDTMGAPAVGK